MRRNPGRNYDSHQNLRSAFTKDDVDEYLYKLLPGGVGEGEYS